MGNLLIVMVLGGFANSILANTLHSLATTEVVSLHTTSDDKGAQFTVETTLTNRVTSTESIFTSGAPMSPGSDLTGEASTVTVSSKVPWKGERPPTRSAQLGMGLGITFIGILFIAEIVYFTKFYRGGGGGGGRHDEYRA